MSTQEAIPVQVIGGTPAAVYRVYGDDDVLLYIGIANDPQARLTEHSAEKSWWPEVRRITITWHLSRAEGEAAEAGAIREENPAYNIRRYSYAPKSRQPRRPAWPLNHEPQAVRYARERLGITRTELAKRLGVALSLISQIESGDRNATPAMLNKLARELNCPRVILERKREAPAGDAA